MSKIEKALKKAGATRDAGNKSDSRKENAQDIKPRRRSGEAMSNLPVKFRLRPGVHHEVAGSVLERNHLIQDGIAEDVLVQYKMLRTKILQRFNQEEWTTLAVTGPRKGVGVTTTAMNLAIAIASHGTRDVTLVDLNLRDPSIAEYFDLPDDTPGLKAYLELDAEMGQIFWDVGIENLSVLASRDAMKDSSENLMSRRMRDLLSAFGKDGRNPIIIYDLPPVLTADDAVAISPLVDAFLLVASEGETGRDQVVDALEALSDANVIGVVLNKSSRRRAI